MRNTPFDRTTEDLGNIVELGHVNTRVPDQGLATLFYVTVLGLTRDPYLQTGVRNMWINVGRSQFHLPTGKPQVLNGVTGLALPDLAALRARLREAREPLAGAQFAFEDEGDAVLATSPWGNRFRCHAPSPRFGQVTLGMPYVEIAAPPGAVPGILRFYAEVFGARIVDGAVAAGPDQTLRFVETDAPIPPFDGAHIQITIVDFSGPHRKLLERGLITEESDAHQYRFQDITDLDTGRVLCTLEHEVRSMRHPMYGRPLVNRDPAQIGAGYAPLHDAWIWTKGRERTA